MSRSTIVIPPQHHLGRALARLVNPFRFSDATGGASAQPDHPSRKHDVDVTVTRTRANVQHDTSGLRRRDRRAAARKGAAA